MNLDKKICKAFAWKWVVNGVTGNNSKPKLNHQGVKTSIGPTSTRNFEDPLFDMVNMLQTTT